MLPNIGMLSMVSEVPARFLWFSDLATSSKITNKLIFEKIGGLICLLFLHDRESKMEEPTMAKQLKANGIKGKILKQKMHKIPGLFYLLYCW